MDSNSDIAVNRGFRDLTYMPWYEHIKEFLVTQWKTILFSFLGSFAVFWGLLEAGGFFYPNSGLNNHRILISILSICLTGSFIRCIYKYQKAIPVGLEKESPKAHYIARQKRIFWEYSLAYELIKNRVERIDKNIDNIINNRIHIKITKKLDVISYINWLEIRPDNMLKIVEVAKQLYIFDLFNINLASDKKEMDIKQLVEVADLIENLYRSLEEFVIEGLEMLIPEGFETVHEIQFEWITSIQDGTVQLLDILKSVAERNRKDFSPLEKTITFKEPSRIDEFCKELERLCFLEQGKLAESYQINFNNYRL